jgi:hypothetical protein
LAVTNVKPLLPMLEITCLRTSGIEHSLLGSDPNQELCF